jgi:hypothetical protein
MKCVRICNNAFGFGASDADDDIEVTKVERLEYVGHKRSQKFMFVSKERKMVEKTGANIPPFCPRCFDGMMQRGIEGSIGVDLVERLKDSFGSAKFVEAIVDQSNFHEGVAKTDS